MPSGGRLSVEVENVRLENWEAAVAVIDAGDYVRLRVADDGIGMDAMTQTRIFEPFFTTKEVGKGTGLGLATVFGIVKQCGGGIVVRSSPGCGAAFDVFFPRATPDEAEEPEAAPCERVGGGQETILVVEDDEQVRRVVCRLLKSRAYTVLEARNAEVALEVLSRRHDAVDLIVTDLVMPDIDGRTMAAMVRERNPRAKVLYMSGYTEHEAVKASSSEPMDHLLRKPFTVEELDGAVRSAIEGRRRKSRDLAPLR
jgi:CheY-like chemotaxis protein